MVSSRSASIAALSSRLLSGLEVSAAHAILAASHLEKISARGNISVEGCRATRFFLIQQGQAQFRYLTQGGQVITLSRLVPGDVIGLVSILKSPPPYFATAEATSDCSVLVWEHSAIRSLISSHPVLAENAFRIALGYLRAHMDRHIGLVTKTAKERLAGALVKLSDRCGEFRAEGVEIAIKNDELGALADVTPFTTSRVLREWVRAGTISKVRGRVLLRAPEALIVK